MKAKQVYLSLPFKVAALFLTILVGSFCLAAGALSLYMYVQRYYDPNAGSYYHTQEFDYEVWEHSSRAMEAYYSGTDIEDYGLSHNREDSNYAYKITWAQNPQIVLAGNYTPEETAVTAENYYEDYVVLSYIQQPLTAHDDFYAGQQRFDQLYPYRYTVIFWCAISFVVGLFLLIYLLSAAGRHADREEVVLNPQDRIPFDLYFFVAGAAFATAIGVALSEFSLSHLYEYLQMAALFLVAMVILLATLMTFATRVKAGKWWRNTIIYRLWSLLLRIWRKTWHIAGMLVREIPTIWKLGVLYCVVALVNLFTALSANWSGAMLFFYFLFNFAILLVICYIGLCMQQLKRGGQHLAAGDLEHKVNTRHLVLDFLQHAENLNSIGDGMSRAVEQRMRSEHLKTELITNVSHDIKTPLTSIVNYVDLLSKEELSQQASEYVAVLERQAKRLSKLTEDLVEASKASTGNLQLDLQRTGIGELVNQAAGEYSERLEDSNLDLVVTTPDQELFALADGRHLWRVLDNLLSNACKYSLTGTRVYVDIRQDGGDVAITFKNISRDQLNIPGEELTERFVRGDLSRHTEGSGLGLNIARSLIELQGGRFDILIDGDLFKAEIHLPCVP